MCSGSTAHSLVIARRPQRAPSLLPTRMLVCLFWLSVCVLTNSMAVGAPCRSGRSSVSVSEAFSRASGTSNSALVEALQRGDRYGSWRRACAAFPDQHMARRVVESFLIDAAPRPRIASPMAPSRRATPLEALVLSNFCEIWMRKHAGNGSRAASQPLNIRSSARRSSPRPRAILTCSATSELALSGSQLESWRSFRRRLVAAKDHADGDNSSPNGDSWAHAISHLERGCLLICERGMKFYAEADGALERSVLLLTEHGQHGSIAFALNRPPPPSLTQPPPESGRPHGCTLNAASSLQLGGSDGDGCVWMVATRLPRGGDGVPPVLEGSTMDDLERFQMTTSGILKGSTLDELVPVIPGLWLRRYTASGAWRHSHHQTAAPAHTHAASPPLPLPTYYSGHYTWGPGELEEELGGGVWRCAAASAAAIAEVLLNASATPDAKHEAALRWVAAEPSYEESSEDEDELAARVEAMATARNGAVEGGPREVTGKAAAKEEEEVKYTSEGEVARLRVVRIGARGEAED